MTNLAANELESTLSENTLLAEDQTRHMEVRSGVAGVVQAGEVSITSGGVLVAVAEQDIKIMSGGGSLLVAGRDISIASGGGSLLVAGNSMNIQNGGGAAMITSNARLNRSFVGLMLCGKAEMHEGSRILLSTPQAAALGAALGIVLAVAGRLIRRG